MDHAQAALPGGAPPGFLHAAAPPPAYPPPYELAQRRRPGTRPLEVILSEKDGTSGTSGTWAKFSDVETGLLYYVNKATGECTYDRPPSGAAPSLGQSSERQASTEQQSKADYEKHHPNRNLDESVNVFASVINGGRLPPEGAAVPPPPMESHPDRGYQRPEQEVVVRGVDMDLFLAARDGRSELILNDLVGAASTSEDESFADVNFKWFAKSDGSGWDVTSDNYRRTRFFWPLVKPKKATSGSVAAAPLAAAAAAAADGDTILHIALKIDRRDILKWLSTVKALDLNVENGKGLTPNQLAEQLGLGSMYTFFFVLR